MVLNILQPKSDKEISKMIGKLDTSDQLIKSCYYGLLYGVKQALENNIDPSICNNMAIQRASEYGHVEIVELLLNDERVDPSDWNNFAIKWVSGKNRKEIIKLLLKDPRVLDKLTPEEIKRYQK